MIIFLYGQDNFRSRSKLNELKDKYLREIDKSGGGLDAVNGAKADFFAIADAIGSSSLLSKKRLVAIEDIFMNKDDLIFAKLAEHLENKKQCDNIIIFWESAIKMKKIKNIAVPMISDSSGKDVPLNKKKSEFFKFLSARKYCFCFNQLNNAELAEWLKKRAISREGKISAKAADMLVGIVGNDGWQISNELDKLLSYKTGGCVEAEDVKNLASGNFSANIFALTDAISVKNKPLAIDLLDAQAEAGLSGGHLFSMFVRQFKILLQAKQALESGLSQRQIALKFKLHAFVAQKASQQARNFTLPVLKNILSKLAEIDFKVKTGQADYITELNILIAKI